MSSSAAFIVPIDIQTIDVAIELDPSAATASGRARMTFSLGPCGGYPFFDLRQPIRRATLDGQPLDPAESILRVQYPLGPDGLLLAVNLAPWSTGHRLELEYDIVQTPRGERDSRLVFDPGGKTVWLHSGFDDGAPGRYLEQWAPANLLFDQFSLRMSIRILGGAPEHAIAANGYVRGSANSWEVVYPDRYNAACPFLRLAPAAQLSRWPATLDGSSPAVLIANTKPGIDLWLASRAAEVLGAITCFTGALGPASHPRPFLCVFGDDDQAMEYAGAAWTTEYSVEHEIVHSWFGRGLMPPMGRDNWIDEAIAVYLTNPNVGPNGDPPADHKCLAPYEPWSRCGPPITYRTVGGMLKHLDVATGGSRLRSTLRDIYLHKLGRNECFLGTEEFEGYLIAGLGNPDLVKSAFAKFVYCK